MSDAEGIRNLVGTGLVQLVGGLVTAVLGLGVLFYLNWQLTVITHRRARRCSAAAWPTRSSTLRPLFRERGKINAEVTGRLTEALGGIRIVKSLHRGEARRDRLHARARTGCSATSRKSMTGVSATTAGSTVIVGIIGVADDLAGRQRDHRRADDARRPDHVHLLHRPASPRR